MLQVTTAAMRRWWVFLALILVLLIADVYVILRWVKFGRPEWRFDPQILEAASRYQVDPALVKAVMWQESRFRPDARGTKQEIGLMQLRSLAAQEWADAERITPFEHEQVSDARTNTLAGAWYLSKLIRRYRLTDDPRVYALADYNAGRTQVLRWLKDAGATNSSIFLEQMDYPGTKEYIRKVLKRHEKYRNEFEVTRTSRGSGDTVH